MGMSGISLAWQQAQGNLLLVSSSRKRPPESLRAYISVKLKDVSLISTVLTKRPSNGYLKRIQLSTLSSGFRQIPTMDSTGLPAMLDLASQHWWNSFWTILRWPNSFIAGLVRTRLPWFPTSSGVQGRTYKNPKKGSSEPSYFKFYDNAHRWSLSFALTGGLIIHLTIWNPGLALNCLKQW